MELSVQIWSLFSKDSIVYAVYRSENFVNKKINPRNVIWIKHDLSNEIKMKIKPDVIIHCAVTHEFKKRKHLMTILRQIYYQQKI